MALRNFKFVLFSVKEDTNWANFLECKVIQIFISIYFQV